MIYWNDFILSREGTYASTTKESQRKVQCNDYGDDGRLLKEAVIMGVGLSIIWQKLHQEDRERG